MHILKNRKLNFFVGIILIGFIAWYVYSLTHQISGVRKICSAIQPRAKLSTAKSIVASYGFLGKREISSYPGVQVEEGTFTWFIVADLTMGDVSCDIKHDGVNVISTNMSEP